MKNIIAVLALSAFFTFSACKKSETTNLTTNVESQTDQFSVDSIKVNDSIKLNDSLTIKYSSKMLVFPSIKDKKLLDSIYFADKKVQDFSKIGLESLLEKNKNEYINSIKIFIIIHI